MIIIQQFTRHIYQGSDPRSIPPGRFIRVSEAAVLGIVLLPTSLPSLICLARIHILNPGRCHDVVLGRGSTESSAPVDRGGGRRRGLRTCARMEFKWRSMMNGSLWGSDVSFEPVGSSGEACGDSTDADALWNRGIVSAFVRGSGKSRSSGSISSL